MPARFIKVVEFICRRHRPVFSCLVLLFASPGFSRGSFSTTQPLAEWPMAWFPSAHFPFCSRPEGFRFTTRSFLSTLLIAPRQSFCGNCYGTWKVGAKLASLNSEIFVQPINSFFFLIKCCSWKRALGMLVLF